MSTSDASTNVERVRSEMDTHIDTQDRVQRAVVAETQPMVSSLQHTMKILTELVSLLTTHMGNHEMKQNEDDKEPQFEESSSPL